MARLLVDLTPLRTSRQYRLLFSGQAISYIGTQLTAVAAPYQVFVLTDSSFAVGMLGLAQIVPLVLGSLLGGAWADSHDRRRLLLIAQLLLGVTSAGLAINAFVATPQVWLIYVLTALAAGFSGLDHPTRSAAVPNLVSRRDLPAALALNQLMWQLGLVVGPALAGLLIARVSIASTYALDVVSFAVAAVTLLRMAPILPAGVHPGGGRASILEGLRFLKGRQALQGTFVIDINAMIFGMPRALFPALGTDVFGGPEAVGLLYAAPAAGALGAAIWSGWAGRVDGQGRGVIWAVVAWGAAVALFGLSPWLWLALVLLAVAGAADVVSAVFRNSILQLTVPDRLRGRLSSVHIAVVTGGPRLGDVEAGAVAALTTPTFAVVSGGVACMAGAALIARLMPALGRWRLADHVDDHLDGPGDEAVRREEQRRTVDDGLADDGLADDGLGDDGLG